ncbi:uncharacterized protein PADG_08403 [Paracoccidioides brasiliensis Pb18]|uniref:Uncharacterized protein n=2 Tax=Paracoccidioides brasiliensis TaxID=121759 RepID=C1GM12_PARBD|nr:uncharacterized protein PADG_08403 [Paracoccidioides brasiliensis Pb18]EEH43478.2 hypothetical protein PADG_08403 [Paracoccidioides brasiliensis Pb18]ODH19684.1 hypothetical protein ACO22_06132 [Paracoccidioides brasiliensis]ODH47715.1 hypothetical protein GX48_06207 [Paracoccidioides brasiliensis]
MFRRPRQTEPERFSLRLSTILQPLPVISWGTLAMWYLGVPIGLGTAMIVVQDNDHTAAIEKLKNAGFIPSIPERSPPDEIIKNLPNPQEVLDGINAGYKRLDQSCAIFNYPPGGVGEKGMQVYLFPNSFAHLSLEDAPHTETTKQYNIYGNLHYPLEQALVESFVKAAIDEEKEAGFSAWGETLRSWVSLMTGYLEVDNDALDHCADEQAVEWYSVNFGRIRETKFGPMDQRISKRLGSGKELPIDMRGNPIRSCFNSATNT